MSRCTRYRCESNLVKELIEQGGLLDIHIEQFRPSDGWLNRPLQIVSTYTLVWHSFSYILSFFHSDASISKLATDTTSNGFWIRFSRIEFIGSIKYLLG